MSIKLADTLAPMGDFPAVKSDNVDITIDGSPKSLQQAYEDGDLGGGGSSIQVETMPAASAENVGKIVQYVGATGSYEHGCFYECKDESGSYVWRYISTVKNGVFYTSDNIIDSTLYPVGSVAVYTGEPLWGLFKGHHYEYVEDTPLTIYKFNGTKNGTTLSFFLANKELEVGSALVRISDGYIVSYVSAINGTTITIQGRTYTETFTDVVETGETEEVASYTGWIDIGGGGSDGGEEGTSIFYGTMDEWDALSTDAKKQYDYMSNDDASGDSVVNVVENGNMHAVTSNAVYNTLVYRNNATVVCTLRRMRTDGTGVEETGTTKPCLVIPLVGPGNLALIIGSGEVPVNSTEVQQKFGFILSGVQADGIVNYGMMNTGLNGLPSPHLSYSAGFHDFWVDGIPTPPPSGTKCTARFMCVAKLQ